MNGKTKFYDLSYINDEKLDLYIYGEISEWSDQSSKGIAADLSEALNSDLKHVDVHINSLGGSVAEGIAIYNLLKNSQAHITTYVDGFACSAASIVFCAGDDRIMPESGILMIHHPWEYTMGNAKTLEEEAKVLTKLSASLEKIYLANSTLKEDEIKELLDGETGDGTWMSAEEAKNYGFATEIIEEDKTAQSYSNSVSHKILNCIKKAQNDAIEAKNEDVDLTPNGDVEKNKKIDILSLDEKLSKVLDKLDKIAQAEDADLTPKDSQEGDAKKDDSTPQKTQDTDKPSSNFAKLKKQFAKSKSGGTE